MTRCAPGVSPAPGSRPLAITATRLSPSSAAIRAGSAPRRCPQHAVGSGSRSISSSWAPRRTSPGPQPGGSPNPRSRPGRRSPTTSASDGSASRRGSDEFGPAPEWGTTGNRVRNGTTPVRRTVGNHGYGLVPLPGRVMGSPVTGTGRPGRRTTGRRRTRTAARVTPGSVLPVPPAWRTPAGCSRPRCCRSPRRPAR
jgi:hypothetical protein